MAELRIESYTVMVMIANSVSATLPRFSQSKVVDDTEMSLVAVMFALSDTHVAVYGPIPPEIVIVADPPVVPFVAPTFSENTKGLTEITIGSEPG